MRRSRTACVRCRSIRAVSLPRALRGGAVRSRARARRQPLCLARRGDGRALDRRVRRRPAGDKSWQVDRAGPLSRPPRARGGTSMARLVEGPAPCALPHGEWPAPPRADVRRPAGPYAVLHVGASSPLKQWAPANAGTRWREPARRARHRARVVGGRARDDARSPRADPQRDVSRRFAGRLDLAQLWQLLAGARVLVAPDTGVAHLGRIVGAPTVALFGPGSALLCGAGDFWRDAPYRAVTVDPFDVPRPARAVQARHRVGAPLRAQRRRMPGSIAACRRSRSPTVQIAVEALLRSRRMSASDPKTAMTSVRRHRLRRRSARSTTRSVAQGSRGGRRGALRPTSLALDRGQPPLQSPAVGRGGRRRAAATFRTPRSRRTSARSTATTSGATTRSSASTRRCSRGSRTSTPAAGAWHNSETAGSMIDRLSILALKIHHMRGADAARRRERRARRTLREKLARLTLQRDDLARCFDTLLARAAEGRAFWRVYRQFKMYNDPALNPYLYKPSRQRSGCEQRSSASKTASSVSSATVVVASRCRARAPSGAQRDAGEESSGIGEESQHAAGTRRGEVHQSRIGHHARAGMEDEPERLVGIGPRNGCRCGSARSDDGCRQRVVAGIAGLGRGPGRPHEDGRQPMFVVQPRRPARDLLRQPAASSPAARRGRHDVAARRRPPRREPRLAQRPAPARAA